MKYNFCKQQFKIVLFNYYFRSSTHSKNDIGASKHRRRPAQAQELLYASKNVDQQRVPLVRVPSASSFLRYIVYGIFNILIPNLEIFLLTKLKIISGLTSLSRHQ